MAKAKPLPSQDELLELFTYNPDTGELFNKACRSRKIKEGSLAGTITHKGYRDVAIKRKKYAAARIIWVMMTGDDPGELTIDHIDRDRSNNRWENLRLATRSQQNCNRIAAGKGYTYYPKLKQWRVRININGKRFWGGGYDTEEAASKAAQELRLQIHGEFAFTPAAA